MKPEDQRLVPKKRYSAPQLGVRGLREITNTKAHNSTNMDGGGFPITERTDTTAVSGSHGRPEVEVISKFQRTPDALLGFLPPC